MVNICCRLMQPSQVSKQKILSTVMTNVTAYKITDHTKPLSIFFSVDASSVACAIINNKNWPIRLQHYCWLRKKILENTHGIQ